LICKISRQKLKIRELFMPIDNNVINFDAAARPVISAPAPAAGAGKDYSTYVLVPTDGLDSEGAQAWELQPPSGPVSQVG
jgi:hypothetical protein